MTPQLMGQIGVAFAQQGEHPAERALLNVEVVDRAPITGGINETMRVAFGNDTYGYHKSFDGLNDATATGFGQQTRQQPIHEVAAWRLASQMGEPWSTLVPPVVLRNVDGVLGSLIEERPGRDGWGQVLGPEQSDAAAFFDCFIGQQDRHPGNYLVSGDRQLALIDHGFCFANPGDHHNYSFLLKQRWTDHRQRLSTPERSVLQLFQDSPRSFGLQGLIEPVRLAAMEVRASRMLDLNTLLTPDQF